MEMQGQMLYSSRHAVGLRSCRDSIRIPRPKGSNGIETPLTDKPTTLNHDLWPLAVVSRFSLSLVVVTNRQYVLYFDALLYRQGRSLPRRSSFTRA